MSNSRWVFKKKFCFSKNYLNLNKNKKRYGKTGSSMRYWSKLCYNRRLGHKHGIYDRSRNWSFVKRLFCCNFKMYLAINRIRNLILRLGMKHIDEKKCKNLDKSATQMMESMMVQLQCCRVERFFKVKFVSHVYNKLLISL